MSARDWFEQHRILRLRAIRRAEYEQALREEYFVRSRIPLVPLDVVAAVDDQLLECGARWDCVPTRWGALRLWLFKSVLLP